MKLTLALTLILVLATFTVASAIPLLFDVWSYGGGHLGQISAFTGDLDPAFNYNYSSASGHPFNGPNPTPYESFVWLYYDQVNSQLSFNIIHNQDMGGGFYWNHVEWDVYLNGMNYNVLLQDDDPENQGEEGLLEIAPGYLYADFAYYRNTDGGVIGIDPDSYCDWSIGFNRVTVGDIQKISAASGDGTNLELWNPNSGEYGWTITPHCTIPEPGTLLLLGSGLLFAGGYLRRRK